MPQLPADAPDDAGAAFARINAVANPSLDDLKTMVYLEASGQVFYGALAKVAPNEAVRRILEANGREELAHAHRVAKAVKLLSGEAFGVPAAAENPYAQGPFNAKADRAMFERLAQGEEEGASLYETWASHAADRQVAQLLLQNAKEEARHGERAKEALALLDR